MVGAQRFRVKRRERDTPESWIQHSTFYHVPVMRWILHADLDAFYASVEQLDNPKLRGKPVVVGGPPEARAVVTTASYEARVFGVRSAMPMSTALRLCPQAIRVSPRFDRYGEISGEVMGVFRAVTPLVEPLSLDEAFLDVTKRVSRYQGVDDIARRLKADVKARTKLTVSIGVATNKTVAKIASDMEKPDGLVVVPAGGEAAFLAPLPVRALWGVGPRAEETLKNAGFETIGQLADANEVADRVADGLARGRGCYRWRAGWTTAPWKPNTNGSRLGAETTFPRDLPDGPELRAELRRVALDAARRLVKSEAIVPDGGVEATLRELSHDQPSEQRARGGLRTRRRSSARAEALLDAVEAEGDMFRLLGVHCTNLRPEANGGEGQIGVMVSGDARPGGAVAGPALRRAAGPA